MEKVLKAVVMAAAILTLVSGGVSIQKGMSDDLFPKVVSRDTAAVSYITEAGSGDITGLGNLWRNRIGY